MTVGELLDTHTLSRPRGRFAPSPTGPLHFGSLIAALASWLDVKSRGGEWLVRIEDLDPPRAVPGAADAILRTLEAFGLQSDARVIYQSARGERYAQALAQLVAAGLAYPCACSRRQVAAAARTGIDGPIYPGTCREGIVPGTGRRAWRLRVPAGSVDFVDEHYGALAQDVAEAVGDFVLRRADGLWAYQLAVVIDDADQGITRVVRGADLLDSSQRQILLQRLLGLPTPAYLHVPAAVGASGEKLSKQNLARPLVPGREGRALFAALELLGQAPPAALAQAGVGEIRAWALAHWNAAGLPRSRAVRAPDDLS